MKKTHKFMIKNTILSVLAASALLFSSCLGLGEAIDLDGPSVTITAPENRENVQKTFTISGTVVDDISIGVVTVKLDGDEWKNEDGVWTYKAHDSSSFTAPLLDTTWDVSSNGREAKFSVKAQPHNNGALTLEISAIDKAGNQSEESTKTRDVIIDESAPLVSIAMPVLKSEEKKTDYTEITDYKDITKVTQFITGDFSISGNTAEDNNIVFIDLIIKDADADTIYFEKRMVQDPKNIKTGDGRTYVEVDSLRSWSMDINLSEFNPQITDKNKHVLKIMTRSKDDAGNGGDEEELVTQGYACLWKEADIPWIEIKLGKTAETAETVYAGSKILGTAFDDTEVKDVSIVVKNPDGSIHENSGKISGEETNQLQFDVTVPKDCGTYCVEITTHDNRDNISETKTGYIAVVDKTFPSISISHFVNDKEENTGAQLFGDTNGNFTFKIVAKDDTEIKSVKMLYVNDPEDVLKYTNKDKDKTVWGDGTTSSSVSELKIKDTVYEVPLTLSPKPEITGDIERKVYTANVNINLFKDLGIDGVSRKLTNQTFVFRVQDGSDNYITTDYSILGDIDAPKIEFTKITYTSGGTTNKYSEGEKLPAFGADTVITVYGKISDNSVKAWGENYSSLVDSSALSENIATGKRLKFILKANGTTIEPTINSDGTFTAVAGKLTGSSLVFKGEAKDYAGNPVSTSYSFVVDTLTPKIQYISAEEKDGVYKAGDTITIFIRFNNLFKFDGGENDFTLTLDNGGTAKFVPETSAKNELKFKYNIPSGAKETSDLNVTGYTITNGKKILDDVNGDRTTEIKEQLDEIVKKPNLSDMKDISIITSKPALSTISFDEASGKLTLTYSRDVEKGSGDVTISQLKSNNTVGMDKAPAVLSDSEYRSLYAKDANFAEWYTQSLNGADANFNPYTDNKYVLIYEKDSNDSYLIKLFTGDKVKAHILSQNVKSSKVSVNSKTVNGNTVNGNTVTVEFGANPLPCKGAKYKIEVPAGFMQDAKGGAAFTATGNTKTITANGIEPPVIRVSTSGTTMTASGNSWTATQPLKAEFKIDCETPGKDIYYKYDVEVATATEVYSTEQAGCKGDELKVERATPSKDNGLSKTEQKYNGKITIGDDAYTKGLTYKITAKVGTVEAYAKVTRTVIEIKDMEKLRNEKMKQDYNYTDKSKWPGATNQDKIGLFLVGGDNQTASNTVKGLPLTWDISDPEGTILLSEPGNNIFYMASWGITVPVYFQMMAGIMDSESNEKGPKYLCNAQNNLVSRYADYPVNPGEYMIVNMKKNKWNDIINTEFSVADEGKPIMVR